MTLPAPSLLAPVSFSDWYPGQAETLSQIMDWLGSDVRFLCLQAPTGSGKSLLSILGSFLSSRPSVILTHTKALQTQYLHDPDYQRLLSDIRGQNSYQCVYNPELNVEEGPCHAGFQCAYRQSGCFYYDKLRKAKEHPCPITNYAYWLSQTNYSDGLMPTEFEERELLICDEAHMAFQALESFLSVRLSAAGIVKIGGYLEPKDTWEEWRDWASEQALVAQREELRLEEKVEEVMSEGGKLDSALRRAHKEIRQLIRSLKTLADSVGDWAWEQTNYAGTFTFTPVWPSAYSSSLFRSVPKVLLMSAFFTPKTADLLGIPPEDRLHISVPSHFPPQNTPVTHIDTVRVRATTTDEEMSLWVNRIDQIIDRRLDRKGIIFTVSYDRRSRVMLQSRHSNIMISHSRDDVVAQVNKFKSLPPPAVLVSPSVTSGWDFPGSECEYIIIGKIPYPDTRPAVIQARQKEDKDWASYTAMQTLVQEAGRGSRSKEDKCEVLIIDDNWKWFKGRYIHFMPGWFKERLRGSLRTVPDSPVKREEVLV